MLFCKNQGRHLSTIETDKIHIKRMIRLSNKTQLKLDPSANREVKQFSERYVSMHRMHESIVTTMSIAG